MANLDLALRAGLRPGRVVAILVVVVSPTTCFQLLALTHNHKLKTRVVSYLINALELRGYNAEHNLVLGELFLLGFVGSAKIRQLKQFVRTSIGSESSPKLLEIVSEKYRANSIPVSFSLQENELTLVAENKESSATSISELLVSLGTKIEERAGLGTVI